MKLTIFILLWITVLILSGCTKPKYEKNTGEFRNIVLIGNPGDDNTTGGFNTFFGGDLCGDSCYLRKSVDNLRLGWLSLKTKDSVSKQIIFRK